MQVQEVTLKRPVVAKRAKTPRIPRAVIIASVIGIVALVDLMRLGSPSLWMDEAISIDVARQPFVTLFAAYSSGAESNMILYYLLLHVWLALGSALHIAATEAFIRLPSAVFAILASVVVYVLGERFFGRFAAIVAALVFTLNGWQLTYAQDARSYSLQLLLVSLTWLGMLAALRPARLDWRWWSVFVLSGALSVYTQAISGVALLALGIAFGLLMMAPTSWRVRARSAFPAIAAGFVVIGALIAPFVYASRRGPNMDWLPAPTLSNLAHHALALGRKDIRQVEIALALLLILTLAVIALLTPWARRQREWLLRRDGGALEGGAAPVVIALVCWLVIPVVAIYVV
jgi:hypothetical protein